MMRRSFLPVLCAALMLVSAPRLHAQDTLCIEALSGDDTARIGCVNRILERKLFLFDKTVQSSDAVQIRREVEQGTTRTLSPIRTNDPLSNLDVLRLGNSVDLELYLSDESSRSRVVLERGGVWELERDSVPRLVISHGQMVVDQLQGRMEAYLENVLNVIHSTRVYYDVDSTAGESFVFLREGHISFPEFGIDVEGSDSLWVIREGMPPEPVAADEAAKRRWRNRENHAIADKWQTAETPILSRPRFWLLAGGLAVGAVLLDCSITNVVCSGGGTGGAYRIPLE